MLCFTAAVMLDLPPHTPEKKQRENRFPLQLAVCHCQIAVLFISCQTHNYIPLKIFHLFIFTVESGRIVLCRFLDLLSNFRASEFPVFKFPAF